MPEEGVKLTPNDRLLRDEEIVRIARLFVGLGVTKIRLTGGEPSVHPNLVALAGQKPLFFAAPPSVFLNSTPHHSISPSHRLPLSTQVSWQHCLACRLWP